MTGANRSVATSKKATVGGKAAGVGGGTLTVFLASVLPEHSPLRPWLLFAAPTISVTISAVSTWAIRQSSQYFRARAFRSELDRARQTVQKGLKTEGTSPQHKALIRKKLEELDNIEIDNTLNRVRNLASTQEAVTNAVTSNVQ
jgi:hypothetical protein